MKSLLLICALFLAGCRTNVHSQFATQKHLEAVVVPTVSFTNSLLADVVAVLHGMAADGDPRRLQDGPSGFNIIVKLSETGEYARVSFDATEVNMYEVLTGVCARAGAELRLLPRDVLIIEKENGQQSVPQL